MTTKSKAKRTNQVEKINSGIDEVPIIYTNHIDICTSAVDVRMDFGVVINVTGSNQNKNIVIKDSAVVFMSPQHAKQFSTLLIKQLEVYEAKVGKIPNILSGEKENN